MSISKNSDIPADLDDELRPEYDLDFRQMRPNRFAKRAALQIVLDPDVAAAFPTVEAVNEALRSLIIKTS